jgi:methylthioribose-1-phosphate isomerase
MMTERFLLEHVRYDRRNACLTILDQTCLPAREVWCGCHDVASVCHAIVTMQVRGAPLIGIVAAYGLAIAATGCTGQADAFRLAFDDAARRLAATRPTAVNLFWAIKRMQVKAQAVVSQSHQARTEALVQEALAIHQEDVAMCRAIGAFGGALVQDGETIMTHCNAGALATGGYGTALGVIRGAIEQGKRVRVVARETRPLHQGSRLTAWELARDGIDVTVIPDSSAAHLMRTGKIHRVVVGADRIAANGDTANKIGTYDLALVAHHHDVPFHVAAPYSTVDFSLPDGAGIPIEERSEEEMRSLGTQLLVPAGAAVWNPAFDVTPANWITSIITEAGIAKPPFLNSLQRLLAGKAR